MGDTGMEVFPMSFSDFAIRVMLASWNGFKSIPYSYLVEYFLQNFNNFFLKCLRKFICWNHLDLKHFLREGFDLGILCLVRLFRLYVHMYACMYEWLDEFSGLSLALNLFIFILILTIPDINNFMSFLFTFTW